MKYVPIKLIIDSNGFDELFGSYYEKIVCFIAQIVKSDEIAQDLAQDLFTKIWESQKNIEITTSVNAYMYMSAKNRALNYLQKKREERLKGDGEDISSNPLEFDAHDIYSAEETLDAVKKAVMAMPEPRREVFILSRQKGLKNEEIANQLGIKIKTVEFHITKALSEIRGIVNEKK